MTLFIKKHGSKFKIAGALLFAMLLLLNLHLSLGQKQITNEKNIDLLGVQMSVVQVSAYEEGPQYMKSLGVGGWCVACENHDQTICVSDCPH